MYKNSREGKKRNKMHSHCDDDDDEPIIIGRDTKVGIAAQT